MGVDGLWKILEPVAKETSLEEYALTESLKKGSLVGKGLEPIVVGIDASIWMNECQAIFYHRHHAQAGENPELRTLFYRLSRLLHACLVPVFVFDGPSRPKMKRGKKVFTQPHWLTARFCELIHAFGFHIHMAPGEAEAELAMFNRSGIFDAIITEDSDAFVFGATCVIRKSEQSKVKRDPNLVRVYTTDAMMKTLQISGNDLLFISLVCGGDYYKSGLPGCGTSIACQLLGLKMGNILVDAANSLSEERMHAILATCREHLREELATNSSKLLHCRHPHLAASVSDSLFRPEILLSYTAPATSKDMSAQVVMAPQLPNIGMMFRACERMFSWGTAEGILKKFEKTLWTGVCLRQILQFCRDDDVEIILIPSTSFLYTRKASRRKSSFELCRVNVYLHELIRSSLGYLQHTRTPSLSLVEVENLVSMYGLFTASLPRIILSIGLPNLFTKPTSYGRHSKFYQAQKNRIDTSTNLTNSSTEIIDLTSL